MKRGIILEAFRFINGIKMNVVKDKETRKAVIANHLVMYKIAQEHDEETKKIYEKLFEGKEEDLRKVGALRQEFNLESTSFDRKSIIASTIIDDYAHIIETEAEFNKIFDQRNDEEIDIKILPFDKEAFIDACADSNIEFTMRDLIRIDGFFKKEEEPAKEESTKEDNSPKE